MDGQPETSNHETSNHETSNHEDEPPGALGPVGEPRPRNDDDTAPDPTRGAWRVLFVGSITASVVSAPLGPDLQSLAVGVIALLAIAGLVVGPRRHDPSDRLPWRLFAWSAGLFLVGNLVRELTAIAVGDIGLGDVFDIAAYGFSIAALLRLARARSSDIDPTRLIDALLAAGGVGTLVWIGVMVPYLRNPGLTVTERVLAVQFSLLSLTVLALAALLATGPGVRNPAYYLLAFATLVTVVTDVVTSVGLSVTGAELDWQPTAALTLSAIGLGTLGSSALHPSMGRVTDESSDPVPEITPLRLTMMAGVLVAPAVLVATTAEGASTLVVVIAWAAMSVLVLARLAGLVRARERTARHDRVLTRMVEGFVGARSVDDVLTLAAATMARTHGTDAVVSSFHADTDGDTDTDSGGWRPVSVAPRGAAPTADHVPRLAAGAPEHQPGRRSRRRAAAGDEEVLVTPIVVEGRLTAALVTECPDGSPEAAMMTGRIARETAIAVQSTALADELHRQRGERRFRALVDNSLDLILLVDDDGRITYVSPSAGRVLGRAEADLVGTGVASITLDEDRHLLTGLLSRPAVPAPAPTDGGPTEIRCRRGDGSLGWFDAIASDMSHVEEVGGHVLTLRDVTERKAAARRLAGSEARFRSLVQHSSDVVCVIDDAHFVTYVSPSVTRVLGLRPEELRDREIWAVVDEADEAALRVVLATLDRRDGDPARLEMHVRDGAGRVRTLDVTVTDLRHDPALGGIVLNAHDITKRKELEDGLARRALHDDLTGLANRALLREQVAAALARHRHRGERSVAVMFIDLDDFKSVNDSYGHAAGDELLRVVADRIAGTLRASDLAARLGGDEFAVLAEGLRRDDAVSLANRLLDAVSEPVVVGGRRQVVRAAAGIAFADEDASTTTDLLRNADTAMYAAKRRAPARVEVFEPALHAAVFERHELKRDLTTALERGELVVWYQPVIELASGRVHGFEALLRWNHPSRGMVSPATFVPLAEESGQIIPITWWVLSTALDQLVTWRAATDRADLVMNVNMPATQLDVPDVDSTIEHAVTTSGLDPAALVVELTESAEIEIGIDVLDRLEAIRRLGVGLAADDFGAGWSSYANLQRLPYTIVKIDKSLIDGMAEDDGGRARLQVRSIIDMAHGAGLRVVAEGVEHARQSDGLERLGCDYGQGYLFSRPLPAAAATEFLLTSTVPPAGQAAGDRRRG
ncbi:MAG: EAL domain-containing protein [Actinomycetota bacterium]|nr:EAL domain-containing protein [Actinomycetota bacterium]